MSPERNFGTVSIAQRHVGSKDILQFLRQRWSPNNDPPTLIGTRGWSHQSVYWLYFKILLECHKAPYDGLSGFGTPYISAADIQSEYIVMVRELVSTYIMVTSIISNSLRRQGVSDHYARPTALSSLFANIWTA